MKSGFEATLRRESVAGMLSYAVRASTVPQLSDLPNAPVLDAAEQLFRLYLAQCRFERLGVAGFDTRARLVRFVETQGQRTAVQGILGLSRAVLGHANVSILVIGHNHPSGIAKPSLADREATRRIAALCRLAGAQLAGHLLLAGEECVPISLS